MNTHPTLVLALSLLTLGPLLVPPASAQEAAFDEVIDVEVVNVDVYVTDKKGRPVTGLGRGDFELRADGEEVEITNFYAVEDGRRLAGEAPEVAGVTATRSQAALEGGGEPVYLVVYIDNLHLGQFTRNRALEDVRAFLRERVRHGDQVMLVTFDNGVKVRLPFTAERGRVESALDEIIAEPGFGHLRERQREQVLADMMVLSDASRHNRALGAPKTRCPIQMGEMAKRYAEQVYGEVHASVTTLTEFVDTLAALPGRKALLHVSDGLPLQPGAEVFEFLYDYCDQRGQDMIYDAEAAEGLIPEEVALNKPFAAQNTPQADSTHLGTAYQPQEAGLDASRFQTGSLFDELTARANANRVTFFTLETYGPRSFSRTSAATDQVRTTSRRADQVRQASLQDSLFTMAERTGGQAILDTIDFAPALERVAQDLDTYYSLGYRLPKSEVGRSVNVEVDVRRSGARVRYRKSLRSRSLAEDLAGRTQAALVHGLADNPLGVGIEIGEVLPMDEGVNLVPIRLHIPLGRIALVAGDHEQLGHLTLYLAARDREERLAPVRTTQVPIHIPEAEVATAREQLYTYEIKMLMRAGEHAVAVGVHDDYGAVGSFMTENVKVAAN